MGYFYFAFAKGSVRSKHVCDMGGFPYTIATERGVLVCYGEFDDHDSVSTTIRSCTPRARERLFDRLVLF